MKLLVTGGAGFIGSNLIQHVIDRPEIERLVNLAERVRQSIAALCLSACHRRVTVTVSVGIASLSELDGSIASASALIALADRRLYAAKAAGRDRVCAHY